MAAYNNEDWQGEPSYNAQMMAVLCALLLIYGAGVLFGVMFLLDLSNHLYEVPFYLTAILTFMTGVVSYKFIRTGRLFFELLDIMRKEG